MNTKDWAISVKPDLITLQESTGIPAVFAAAQFCHESNSGSKLSDLALNAHNYGGLKWSEWQKSFGCTPVRMGTWEEVDGQRMDVTDAFCKCPSWQVWLQVYGTLLTGSHYGPALKFAADPLLYGHQIWGLGWATDSHYVPKLTYWMMRLWDDYADTLQPKSKPVKVLIDGQPHDGYRNVNGRAEGPLRPLLEVIRGAGGGFAYDGSTDTLTVTRPRPWWSKYLMR